MTSGLDESLLAQLTSHAGLPIERATALPPGAYTDPAVLRLERERIFASEWLCVGRTMDVPASGDYVTRDVPSAHDDSLLSVIVVRGDDGVVRAFANVCAHRCATLLDGAGSTARITCPYHAWVYRLDGQCIAAPYMQQTKEADGTSFDPANHRLAELATEVWEGFVYISQAAHPTALAPRVVGLTDVVSRYRMADYVTVAGGTEVWETNWKCLTENFLDAYHVFKVHKNTFAKDSDSTGSTTVYPGGEGYTYHVAIDDPASAYGTAHATNDVLEGTWRYSTMLTATYPTHVIQLQPDWLWYLVLSPIGVGQVHIRWSLAIAPEVWNDPSLDREPYLARILDLITAVNGEDRPVIEGVWRALHHRDAQRGPFSYLERNVYDIGHYVATRVTTETV
ncbi:MAG TPA: SRPBCC family protein [Ilumatobacteraceae bacterium]|nr:SRPBCC family protein [Ilumatobacteraceae bacterium]HRB02120.1 SRPBCC family protein [Ilumatobacteraceae bacterium]